MSTDCRIFNQLLIGVPPFSMIVTFFDVKSIKKALNQRQLSIRPIYPTLHSS